MFSSSSPRYHPYPVVQHQTFHPEHFPAPLMNHGNTPVGMRMGSPHSPRFTQRSACGPYPRFGDSVNTQSPNSVGSGSSIQPVSPVAMNRNRMSPYQENRPPWNCSPGHASQESFHGMRPPQREVPKWMGTGVMFSSSPPITNVRPNISCWAQRSPQSPDYRYYPTPKSRRGLNYKNRGSKGEAWRRSLNTHAINLEQQPLEGELNTTSQPHPLAPLATSTPQNEDSDSDVNVVDDADNKTSSGLAGTESTATDLSISEEVQQEN